MKLVRLRASQSGPGRGRAEPEGLAEAEGEREIISPIIRGVYLVTLVVVLYVRAELVHADYLP